MDVGVLTVPLGEWPLDRALEYLDELGVDAVELGAGGHPGTDHLSPRALLDDADERAALREALDAHEMTVSALATHNNPLHPDSERAADADADLRRAIELADLLDVDTVTCFSGLPAGAPGDETPNWITAPWPPEHREALAYQWDVAIEYWRDVASHAERHGVDVAVEMHPNMLVHEPHGLVRLREATGARIGANVDPSHLYWQRIEPTAAIRYLGRHDAVHHVHAKDTEIYEANVRTRGVLDAQSYGDERDRSWLFRTVGYGHGAHHWRTLVSALRLVGYDGALSIEHEDALMSSREGLEKAVELLDRVVVETRPGEAFWTR
ncbi:TIM barrel protein [Halobellus sp. GM3]|uniref:TIM barrel protein n=1 Tax=Halobellus sp. GM3 TaxID=3458410 RepID=UPI00403DCF61